MQYRHIGDRPANEDDSVTAEGYTVLDFNASYRFDHYRVQFVVDNLLDSEWNEAQFDTESQLRGEAVPAILAGPSSCLAHPRCRASSPLASGKPTFLASILSANSISNRKPDA